MTGLWSPLLAELCDTNQPPSRKGVIASRESRETEGGKAHTDLDLITRGEGAKGDRKSDN